jgi:4a-hydroxytetrahydrobiopterin dehydratase
MDSELRTQLAGKRCQNLPKGSPALSEAEVTKFLQAVPQWRVSGKGIEREYKLTTYMNGVKWFALLAAIADQEDHHPDALVTWRKVQLSLWTHTVGGLSENDFILAAKLELAFEEFQKGEQRP